MQRSLLGLAVVALVAIAWIATGLLRSPDADGPHAAAQPALLDSADAGPAPGPLASTAAKTREALPPAEAAPETEPARSTADEGTTLMGIVRRRGDGRPVAGARVRARVDSWKEENALETTTEDDGTYRFLLTEGSGKPRHVRSLEVRATQTTASVRILPDLLIPIGETRTLDLQVTSGTSVSGRVVDASGAAVPEATVLAWCRTQYDPSATVDRKVVADVDGSFTLLHLGGDFFIAAEAPGLACNLGVRAQIPGDQAVEGLELQMLPAAELRGQVLGHGRPLADASIQLRHNTGSWEARTPIPGIWRHRMIFFDATTDSEGRFRIGPVAERAHNGAVAHDDFLRQHVTFEPNRDMLIELDPGAGLSGRILTADGTPIEGAHVRIRSSSEEGLAHKKTTTGEDGSFRFSALVECKTAIVSVIAEGYAIHVEHDVVVGRGARELVLHLQPGLSLAGEVFDEQGVPVPHVRVAIEGDRLVEFPDVSYTNVTTWEWQCGKNKVTSDAHGRFRIDGLYDGAFAVRAQDPDDPQRKMEVLTRAGDEAIVISFDRALMDGLVLEGHVTDGLTGKPIPAFTVTPMIRDEDGGATGHAREVEDEAGVYELPGYRPGTFSVAFQAEGYARHATSEKALDLGRHRIDAELFPSRNVELIVTDDQERPARVRARFFTPEGLPVWTGDGQGWSSEVYFTNGHAIAQGLPARRLTVRFTETTSKKAFEFPIDLTDAPSAPLEFVLEVPSLLQFDALVLEHTGEAAEELLEQFASLGPEAPRHKAWVTLDRLVTVSFQDARGTELAHATLEPDGEAFHSTFHSGDQSDGSQIPFPGVSGQVSDRATVAVVSAEGFEAQTVDLSQPAPIEGMRLILLKRL